MKTEIIPTVQAIAEIMPPRKNGFFEKSLEVAHLILDHEPVSIIAHTVDGAIQTYGMIKETKYRAKAVKYAAHLEEVRLKTAVELAKIQSFNTAMNVYIERSFQQALDNIEKSYLSQTNLIDKTRRLMIKEINDKVENHYANIDKRYIDTVRENEMKCAMYRDFINSSESNGVSQNDITLFIVRKLGENMSRYNSRAVISVCEVLKEIIRQSSVISFEDYLHLEKQLKRF